MADVKISELPQATAVSDSDIVVINQGGTTKTAVRSLIKNPGTVTSVTAGTGLSGGTITGSGTVAVNYGNTVGTSCQGNDSRLSNPRTPLYHADTHGNLGGDRIVITSEQISGSLTQNTSGTAANVTGNVAITNGGTGQITAQGAINTLAGAVTSGNYLRGDGSNVLMSTIQAADVPTLNQNTTGTAANVTGTVAIANGGTGATDGTTALANLGNAIFPVTVRQASNITPASTTATTMTFAVGAGIAGTATIDGYTIVQGDTVCFILQTTPNQSGPWVITTLGTASVGAVLTRPPWFTTGTAKSGTLCVVQTGTANTGFILALSGPLNGTNAPIAIGTATITVSTIWGRSTLATISANTFTGTQTLPAGTLTSLPAKFSASSLLVTTPLANGIEWDNNFLYTTTSGLVRAQQAAFVPVPATATSAGVAGQIAYDATGFYVCTAINTWRKTALATF